MNQRTQESLSLQQLYVPELGANEGVIYDDILPNDPLDVQGAPQEASRRQPRIWRRAAAAVTLTATLGACTGIPFSGEGTPVAAVPGSPEAIAEAFLDDLDTVTEALDKIDDRHTFTEDYFEAQKLLTKLSPESRQNVPFVIDIIDRVGVNKAVYKAEQKSDLEQALEIAETIQSDVRRSEAFYGISLQAADNAISSGVASYASTKEVAKEVADIPDQSIKERATLMVDQIVLNDAMDECVNQEDPEEAREIAEVATSEVGRERIRDLLSQCEALLMQTNDTSQGYAMAMEARKTLSAINHAVDNETTAMHYALSKEVDAFQQTVAEPTFIEISDTYNRLTTFIAAHNSISLDPHAIITREPLANPAAPIDLSDIKGTKKFKKTTHESYTFSKTEEFEQFAEVIAANGEIHFVDQSKNGGAAIEQIRKIIDHNLLVLRPAFASGQLATVRFIIGGESDYEYGPFYRFDERAIYMVLPGNDSVTEDMLNVGIFHEAGHALSRDVMHGGETNHSTEIEALAAVCSTLKSRAYERAGQMFANVPELLEAAKSIDDPAVEHVITEMQQLLREGTADELLIESMSYRDASLSPAERCVDQDLIDLYLEVAYQVGEEATVVDQLEKLYDSEAWRDAVRDWDFYASAFSVYKSLNESEYVVSESAMREYLGHSQDNNGELIASVLDVSVNYTDQFIQIVNEMSAEERSCILAALHPIYVIVSSSDPALASYLYDIEMKIATGTGQ